MEVNRIKDLFAVQNRKFKIPAYQRSYSWEEKQINQFIEDLENATERYYFGHFLFEKSDDGNTLFIVDGQQRLTTCVIFFSCLAHELSNRKLNGENFDFDIDDIIDYYIKDLRKKTQKLETVDEDNHYFLDVVVERVNHAVEETTLSQKRIQQAVGIFEKKFAETDTEKLIRWCNLVQNASITWFTVADKIQAAQIFAFQNDRGKPLSKLEIVKSFFMLQTYMYSENKDIAIQNIQYLEAHFSDIYKKIVRISLHEDDVLAYYWQSSYYKGFNSGEVVEGMKRWIKMFNKIDNVDIIDVIKETVAELSQAFSTVEKIEQSNDCYVRDLRYLNNMSLSYPFFMAADRMKISEATFHRLAHFLENITFRSLLRGGRADIKGRLSNKLIYVAPEGDESIGIPKERINDMIDKTILDIKTKDTWSYWNNDEMKRILNDSYFYMNRVDNYVLWKYEMYLNSSDYPTSPKVSFKDFISNESIEHIAPQTPTNSRPDVHGYGEYDGENGIETDGWMNCLGNLMLISQKHNSAVGNRPFEQKLASYGKDNLLNQQKEIVEFVEDREHPVWDVKAIEKRQKKILTAAMDIWSLDKI